MTSEKEAVSEDARPLDKAAVKRLSTLLNEITDMHVGLGRRARPTLRPPQRD